MADRARAAGPVIGRRHAAAVGGSSVFSAVVSYVVLLLGAHHLSPADNSLFLAFWALFFGMYGVVTGVAAESARAGHSIDTTVPRPTGGRPRILWVALAFSGTVATVVGLSGLLWGERVLDADHAWLVWVVALAGLAYAGQLAVQGVLTGQRQWRGVAGLTLLEALARLGAVMVVVVTGASLAGFAVAAALSSAAWLALLGAPWIRRAASTRADVPASRLVSNFGHAASASAASAALVVGFPVLIRLTSTETEYLASAALLLAIALTRAPLMVPLTAYQGVVLTHFLQHRERGVAALYPVNAALAAVTVVSAGLAVLVGPEVLALVVGADYVVPGSVLGLLTVSAGLLAMLTVSGACTLALGGHRMYASGWVVATAVALGLLLLVDLPLEERVPISLIAGPLVGMGIHVVGLQRRSRRPAPAAPVGQAGQAGQEGGTDE